MDNNPSFKQISAPPRSTQHEEKPLGLFWQFRPSTSYNNDTLYYNLLQDLSIRHKTRDRAERQFTQLLLSDGGQKKPAGKNPVGEKKTSAGNLGRNHGSNSKKPILRGHKFQTRLPVLTKRTLYLKIYLRSNEVSA